MINVKNKKAILMPETLKIILAVVAIVALIYLAVSMYGLLTKKSSIEQARGTLEQVVAKIGILNETMLETKVLVLSPKDWFIVAFSADASRPKSCLGNCVCICEDTGVDDCNAGGLCKEVSKMVIISSADGYIEIDKAFDLTVRAREDLGKGIVNLERGAAK